MAYDNSFASLYDVFTESVNYSDRADYICKMLSEYGVTEGTVLDVACGTGTLTEYFLQKGFEIVATDISAEMLSVAGEKLRKYGDRVLLLCQDMCELDLYGTVDAAVCSLDAINHLLDKEDIFAAFSSISMFIRPGGVFAFDVNTVYKHQEVLANNCFVYENKNTFCAWQNSLDKDGVTVDISLDFFDKTENDGLYCRYSSDFSERAYEIEDLKKWLSDAGFEVKAVFDEDSFLPLRRDSQRAVIVAVKK